MDLSILIISYNTRELTLECLRSVYEQTAGLSFEVIVLDNVSADGSADAIAERFPHARLIRSAENLGFARGNNVVAREARGEYLLLLNPDTVILDGAVQKAVAFARAHPEAGIVGGRTFFADATLNYTSCHGAPTPWDLVCKIAGVSSLFRRSSLLNPESLGSWKRDTVRAVDCVTGCFLLIRRDLWEQLGGFDETFFMYGEETDLCLRAWAAGHSCVLCPEATLVHYGGASEKVRADKMVRLFKAKAQLFDRHWPRQLRRFGPPGLDAWAFTRMAALSVLKRVQPRRAVAWQTWRDVWRRRAEWRMVSTNSTVAPRPPRLANTEP